MSETIFGKKLADIYLYFIFLFPPDNFKWVGFMVYTIASYYGWSRYFGFTMEEHSTIFCHIYDQAS